MRDVVAAVQVSLDGYLATETGELDWIFPNIDEELGGWIADSMRRTDTQLMGRVNYEEQAQFWPTAEDPLAPLINDAEKIVFSSEPLGSDWKNARLARGDVRTELQELRKRPGKEILVPGGARFLQSVSAEGLIDEYRIVVHPVVLGQGLPLFTAPLNLRLVETRSFATGTIAVTYRRA